MDFDSNDSVADADFDPNLRRHQLTKRYNFSSYNDKPIVSVVPSTTLNKSSKNQTDDVPWSRYPYSPHIFQANYFQEPFRHKIPTSKFIEIFSITFGDDFLGKIVTQSNGYAQQMTYSLESILEELKAFLAILNIMGFNPLPSLRFYLSSNQNCHYTGISNKMPLKIFLKTIRFIHITHNDAMPRKGDPEFDNYSKFVRCLLIYHKKSYDIYNPSRNLTVVRVR